MDANSNSTSTFLIQDWGCTERVEINEYPDRIEIIYKQTNMITLTIHPSPPPEERAFKIIYSCIDCKWNKSEPIYGKVVNASRETYEF